MNRESASDTQRYKLVYIARHPLARSLICSFIHFLTHLLTHSLTIPSHTHARHSMRVFVTNEDGAVEDVYGLAIRGKEPGADLRRQDRNTIWSS